MGTRRWREPTPEGGAALASFSRQALSLLRVARPLAKGGGLELRALTLDPTARAPWISYCEAGEQETGSGGVYERIRSFAGGKLPEHAARLAAVLTLFDDVAAGAVSGECMARGIELAKHYAAEAVRLFESTFTAPDLPLAEALLDWLHSESWPHELVSLSDVYQYGPNPIRDKSTGRRIVAVLTAGSRGLRPAPLLPATGGATAV